MKNNKVVVLSLIALLSIYLTLKVHWMFIGIAALISLINWRLLTNGK